MTIQTTKQRLVDALVPWCDGQWHRNESLKPLKSQPGAVVTPRSDRGSQGRGSQRRAAHGPRLQTGSGGRPSGRPRIATCCRAWCCAGPLGWRSPSGVAEDRNGFTNPFVAQLWAGGGRPPGRPRIATTSWRRTPRSRAVAVSSGAAEDRNAKSFAQVPRSLRSWRSLPGAAEDRNCDGGRSWTSGHVLAVAPGATEDRNELLGRIGDLTGGLTVAPRGGRGSQRHAGAHEPHRRDVVAALRGSRIATLGGRPRGGPGSAGGRPSGRPRIATPSTTPRCPRSRPWRSPSGAAEDRNAQHHTPMPEVPPVAVALRGGRAEDRNMPRARLTDKDDESGGRPPGVAEDRNISSIVRMASRQGLWRSSSRATEIATSPGRPPDGPAAHLRRRHHQPSWPTPPSPRRETL